MAPIPACVASSKARGVGYVLAVSSDRRVVTGAGTMRADQVAKTLPRGAWQQRSAGPGAKGPRLYDWALVDIDADQPGHRWLLIRRNHSRKAVASHVAPGETAQDALRVVKKGIASHGVPQRLLTDNGLALNPTRRGWEGQLVAYVTSLGVEAITGKPYKPTTQGKNERFHQTLFRWLDKQPLASSIAELQEQVDRFDVICNTERPHQGLPGRITPQQAWDATPVAEPPRPKPADSVITAPAGVRARGGQGSREVKVQPYGYVYLHGIKFQIAKQRAGQTIHAVWDETGVVFADANGEILIERGWPPKGQTYVSNGIRRGRPSK